MATLLEQYVALIIQFGTVNAPEVLQFFRTNSRNNPAFAAAATQVNFLYPVITGSGVDPTLSSAMSAILGAARTMLPQRQTPPPPSGLAATLPPNPNPDPPPRGE